MSSEPEQPQKTPRRRPHGAPPSPHGELPKTVGSSAHQADVLPAPSSPGQAEIDFVWRAFSNVNDWVRFSDAKAAAVLAADGVLVASIAAWLAGTHTSVLQSRVVVAWLGTIAVAAFYSAARAQCSLIPRHTTSEES